MTTHGCAGPVCRLCAHERTMTAMAQAERAAQPDFLKQAAAWIRSRPSGFRFTTDELWAHLDDVGAWTPEPRAIGAVIRAAARHHLIASDGTYVPSCRPEAHQRPVPVWTRI